MSVESRLRAAIEVLAATVRPGEGLQYRISNTGSVDLICGLSYRLERRTSDGWLQMNSGMTFRLIGFGVLPGKSHELKVTIPADAPAGSYRISTSANSDHVRGGVRLSAEFDVVRDG